MGRRLLRIEDWELLAAQADYRPAKMASLCHISLRQLERFFGQVFGMTPTRWNCELKCRIAAQLIAKGYSNKAVTVELKFSNPSHLCHAFKTVYGASPQTFAQTFHC